MTNVVQVINVEAGSIVVSVRLVAPPVELRNAILRMEANRCMFKPSYTLHLCS